MCSDILLCKFGCRCGGNVPRTEYPALSARVASKSIAASDILLCARACCAAICAWTAARSAAYVALVGAGHLGVGCMGGHLGTAWLTGAASWLALAVDACGSSNWVTSVLCTADCCCCCQLCCRADCIAMICVLEVAGTHCAGISCKKSTDPTCPCSLVSMR